MTNSIQDKARELAKQMIPHRDGIVYKLMQAKGLSGRIGQSLSRDGLIYTLDGKPIIMFHAIKFEQKGDKLKASQPYDILV